MQRDFNNQEVESMGKAAYKPNEKCANTEIFETTLQWACAEGCVCAFRCQYRGTWYLYTVLL